MFIGGAPRSRAAAADLPVLLWPAAVVMWGPGGRSALHAHHAIQLVLALRGTLRVRRATAARWQRGGGVIVAADTPHEIDTGGADVLVTFVDPESALGAALHRPGDRRLRMLSVDEARDMTASLGDPRLTPTAVDRWLRATFGVTDATARPHPGVRRVLRALRAQPLERDAVSLARLAAMAGLSPSRFMHAFTESVGVPLRPYLLWLRLQRAAGALSAGASITIAAHHAGFADAAHLTRTFRRMLGDAPSAVVRRSQFVQARALAAP